jgi:cyclic pyranopterin phosphate synthase
MVDVSGKEPTRRSAVAEGEIRMSREAFSLVEGNAGPKGDVLVAAELAGIMAAKKTAELIPLCHPIPLEQVVVEAMLDPELPGVRVRARVVSTARTGVEMEALTAAGVALLTVYDMVKATDRGMEITNLRLLEKSGGRSGKWRRA